MSNTTKRDLYRTFLKEASARYGNAGEVIKQAADEEALNGIKDPNSVGNVSIPGFGDGSNRSALGIPESRSNMGEPNRDRNIINVTNPDGTGQGEYISPQDGDARDARATSPTTPLDKMAGISQALSDSANAMRNAFTAQQPVEKQAAPAQNPAFGNTDLPESLDNPDIMSKLAAMSLVMLGTEDGARVMEEALEKEAGVREARAIINQVHSEIAAYNDTMSKQANEVFAAGALPLGAMAAAGALGGAAIGDESPFAAGLAGALGAGSGGAGALYGASHILAGAPKTMLRNKWLIPLTLGGIPATGAILGGVAGAKGGEAIGNAFADPEKAEGIVELLTKGLGKN